MKKIGVFYGSTSGKTLGIVDEIEFYLRGNDYEVYDVANGINSIEEYDNLILVSPTYGVGELQSDWENVFPQFKNIDFTNKTVAIVGLGNQYAFGESFVGAMKILYDAVTSQGGTVIGFTPDEGYHYEETEAVINGQFIGLALDEANQDDDTPDRIAAWLEEIKPLFQ